MKKFFSAFFLVLVICMCVVGGVFGKFTTSVFADSNTHTVTFDFNVSRISQYIPQNKTLMQSLESFSLQVEDGECASCNRKSMLGAYYKQNWSVDGKVVDLNEYKIFKDTRFVAVWTPINYKAYFHFENDEVKSQVSNCIEEMTFNVESNKILLYTPERKNYYFLGWFDNVSSIVQLDIPAGSIGDKNFYARFRPIEYAIDYGLGKFKDVENDNPDHYNVESASITLKEPKVYGHIFKGWYLDDKYKEKVTTLNFSNGGNIRLYALWELETYKVTFVLPDGNQKVMDVEYGKKAELPNIKKSIFEIVVTDVSRDNITKDTVIVVKLVNIWYVYVIALLLVVGIIVSVILIRKKHKNTHNKLRLVYQSNLKRRGRYK